MSDPVLTLCTSDQLASIGPVTGILAVCDSPITAGQISAAAFPSWPESSPLACLALADRLELMPSSIRWLAESPFRSHVILCRTAAVGQSLSADALWKQLVATEHVWTGSIAEASPIPKLDWPALAPDHPRKSWLPQMIETVQGVSSRQSTLLKAGLYQLHDFLDESHIQSQSLEGDRDADLWHAIMHRREPDYGNARYWCRRVGSHPVHDQLAPLAAPLLAQAGVVGFSSAKWDSFRFVDLCEQVKNDNSPAHRAAREVQWLEMTLHLAHCALTHRAKGQ
jgi:hypothetical protein